MFLRRSERKKSGKTHSYWNVVENKRLDSSQATAWRKAIEVFVEDAGRARGRRVCSSLAIIPQPRQIVGGDREEVKAHVLDWVALSSDGLPTAGFIDPLAINTDGVDNLEPQTKH